jgi:NADPH-ferrihemoprotein reductase
MIASKASVFFVSTYGVGSSSSDALKFKEWVFSEDRK